MDITSALNNYSLLKTGEEKLTIKKQLSAYLNHLLAHDFAALLQVLYRVDVSEQKLKWTVEGNKEADAGDLLAELVIDRQLQKQVIRSTSTRADNIPEEEKW